MAAIEQSIEVGVPLTTTYNPWTQFEERLSFVDDLGEVRQLHDRQLHWGEVKRPDKA
jgi:uncharacterized membrane protein